MAEEKANPLSAVKPPVANPLSAAKPAAAGATHAATLKLKPVIRKPGATSPAALRIPTAKPAAAPAPAAPAAPAPVKPAAPAAPVALEQLKTVTQKLKGVTQQIPQQAILHKTGIIADQALTDAQKQASKARTARISLSDAMGVAPVKNEAAPMKTIRIKRPGDLAAPAAAPAAPAAAAPASETSVTQKKTLKVVRPGGITKAPTKLGLKKPATAAKPAEPAKAEGGDVPEIADIPNLPPVAAMPAAPAASEADVPAFVGVLSLIVQAAACVAIGLLGFWLYKDCGASPF